ncbi:MAG TPA: PD-(D/E)XK nuclease family protein [Baekduia sp.]|uniref:PD-(D/E)XK nuclease family protein n=1 Tax=Baekduia sp. TaxID=2600305 RepID=UPI002B85EB2B|nr:PD-(D/E)XK nuclease family protein [Baekduia sp.]HMJ35250.1 PD-(D/E)XK nuclease family protein [Baekduia sp.]
MPLHLVTGPANAAKARTVLAAARARAATSPLLVVPTFGDIETYRRELAEDGAVLGVRVERFSGLLRELAFRGGVPGGALSALQRERVAAAAIAATPLQRLAAAAATPGFAPALVAFAEELGEARIEPPRFVRAVRDWAGDDASRRAYADELGALVLAYRRAQERTGRRDRPQHVTTALDALRLEPDRWGGTPVLLYGFDDLSPLQRDVVDTLANAVGADVLLSLTFEPGRTAFAARATLHQDLLALGATEEIHPASADYYAPGARSALHHVERSLYEPDPERVDPGEAIVALEGGGERAEIELVAAEVARLIRAEGVAPEEVAVVHRGLDSVAALVDQVFRAYDLPAAVRRRIAVGHTALGRGLVAMLRCALLDATADDLLTWLRTPGVLRVPAFADRLESRARRQGARTAREARTLWEQEHWELEALDHLAQAYARGGVKALGERVEAEAAALLAAPWRRSAPVLDEEGELDARVAAQVRRALRELAALPPDLQPDPAALAATLDGLEVFVGADAGPGRVTVTQPQSLRARRVRALFCIGLQEGVFPAPTTPEPFLGDDERREINAASGLRLALHEDALHVERLFFYSAVSRPTDLLALSWHAANDEGAPSVRSLLVDDVADLLPEGWADHPRRRELGAAGWLAVGAPTDREAARFAAAAAPPAEPPHIGHLTAPAALGPLRERHTWSASQLEVFSSCPVKWFVDRHLRPEALVPDPEPMIRGELAHRVLEHALSSLVGVGGLSPERLPEARALVHAALDEHADDFRISPNPERLRSALRRLEVDLVRYLEYAAHAGSAFRPSHFEVKFGMAEDPHPALELDGGALRLAGRIDRIDTDPSGREAIVYDYKGKTATAQARWLEEGKLQIGLYLLTVRHVLGLEAVGGLYQPLGATDGRPRGAVLAEADPGLDTVKTDRVDEHELEALLEQCAAAARDAVARIRAGALEPAPDKCAYSGGCAHPTICRCVTA